jgi:hypothetical protein
MSIKSKLLAGAATLTLVGGVGLAGALTAGPAAAGTPSCGPGCYNLWNQDFGPNYVVDVLRQGEKVNQPIILFRNANFDPAEDWSLSFQGTVADFFVAGLVDAATALHYGCDPATTGFAGGTCNVAGANFGFPNLNAFEIEYAPFGVDSGLCMGVAATAFQDEGVSLQPCGVSAKTVWIVDGATRPGATSTTTRGFPVDTSGASAGELPGYVPLINGSNTNFSHPFVLTYPNNAFPTDKPRPQITVQNLTGFEAPGNGGVLPIVSTVSSNQLWNASLGVSP